MTIFYLLIFLIGLLGNQLSLSKLLLHDGHAILLSVAFILKHFAYPKNFGKNIEISAIKLDFRP